MPKQRQRLVWALVVSPLLSGCASPPISGPQYAGTVARLQRAAASIEFDAPVTLPREPALQGAHPVEFYVEIARQRNPRIQAAREAVAAQAQRIPQVTALDDPMLSDQFMPITDNSLQTAAGRVTNTLTVSQRFPWFGKLRVRGEVAEQDVQMALARLAQSELQVVEEVRLAYYELYFNQRSIRITEESRELLQDMLEIANARYGTAEASQQDVLRAQVELDRIDARLIDLRRSRQQLQADLASLLHASPEVEAEAIAELRPRSAPEEITQLYELAVRCRPELRERLAAIVREQRNEELSRLQYAPDVTLGIGWQSVTTDEALSGVANGNDNLMFSVGVNLPIWRDKLQAGVNEARLRTVENARRYDATRDDTFRQIRRLSLQATATEEQLTLFRENIIPRAEQTLQISIADYQVGRIDFLTLINNWNQLLTFQTQRARLEANLEQALASLERVLGCTLAEPEDGQRENAQRDERQRDEEASTRSPSDLQPVTIH